MKPPLELASEIENPHPDEFHLPQCQFADGVLYLSTPDRRIAAWELDSQEQLWESEPVLQEDLIFEIAGSYCCPEIRSVYEKETFVDRENGKRVEVEFNQPYTKGIRGIRNGTLYIETGHLKVDGNRLVSAPTPVMEFGRKFDSSASGRTHIVTIGENSEPWFGSWDFENNRMQWKVKAEAERGCIGEQVEFVSDSCFVTWQGMYGPRRCRDARSGAVLWTWDERHDSVLAGSIFVTNSETYFQFINTRRGRRYLEARGISDGELRWRKFVNPPPVNNLGDVENESWAAISGLCLTGDVLWAATPLGDLTWLIRAWDASNGKLLWSHVPEKAPIELLRTTNGLLIARTLRTIRCFRGADVMQKK